MMMLMMMMMMMMMMMTTMRFDDDDNDDYNYDDDDDDDDNANNDDDDYDDDDSDDDNNDDDVPPGAVALRGRVLRLVVVLEQPDLNILPHAQQHQQGAARPGQLRVHHLHDGRGRRQPPAPPAVQKLERRSHLRRGRLHSVPGAVHSGLSQHQAVV